MGTTTPAFYKRALGRRIRQLREARDLHQHELGLLTGRCQATVAGWEAGTRTPSLVTLRLVAAALQVDIADLLAEDEP